LAAAALPLALGVVLGFAWSQASDGPSARAQSPEAPKAKSGEVRRFGSVIGLRPEKKEYYLKLHANAWPGVLAQIRRSNIRNYSIYLADLEGKLYLFSYFEYVGDDFEADIKKIAADPVTQPWWKETEPCQIGLAGTPEGGQWMNIAEVFHTD
jgi:L-rhamnose mutarotase